MALPRRDRGSTRGNHGILTVVDWCFGGGLAARPGSTRERRKLDSERKKVGNKVVWLGELATAMKVAQRVLYRQETRDGGGARTRKDDRRARHILAEAARRALINLAARRWQTFLWVNSVPLQCFFVLQCSSALFQVSLSGVVLSAMCGQGSIDFCKVRWIIM
jgi:hypothetical protein